MMIKRLSAIIRACVLCPHHRAVELYAPQRCNMLDLEINPSDLIMNNFPSFCPLPNIDIDEENNER